MPVDSTMNDNARPRKLVLCFDGTGNKFRGDDSDSNILKIFRMLDRTADDQFHYYQPGIGTYVQDGGLTRTSLRARIRSSYKKAKDSAVGSSFDQHVVGGYRFLMRFYKPGDEIYLFGFSRGSYIARFLAEMLDFVGLLSHGNEEMVAFAWKAFSQWQCRQAVSTTGDEKKDEANRKTRDVMYEFLRGFRETFSRPVNRIRFLGLFDTVNSVPRFETAWMQRSKFPYTARSSAKVIRHAVSIDERRAKFRQDLIYQSHENKVQEPEEIEDEKQVTNKPNEHERYRGGSTNVGTAATAKKSTNTAKLGSDLARRTRSVSTDAPGLATHDVRLNSGLRGEDRGRESAHLSVEQSQRSPTPYRASSRSRSRVTRQPDGGPSEVMRSDACSMTSLESEDESDQDVDEVWFAGGHADVGGGWELVAGSKSTSHVPLVWMVHEAIKAGLAFDMTKVIDLGCSEALADDGPSAANCTQTSQGPPTITIDDSDIVSPPPSSRGDDVEKPSVEDKPLVTSFREMVHQAHVARIHDSLDWRCGLTRMSILSWKIMEYLPFRRMDLLPDGSWKPIRWPLPCGEVRDIPRDARIHGSVIRRLQTDQEYRPGNLIIGGGGRGVRRAPSEHGIGTWTCVANPGNPVNEIWVRADS